MSEILGEWRHYRVDTRTSSRCAWLGESEHASYEAAEQAARKLAAEYAEVRIVEVTECHQVRDVITTNREALR